MSDNKEKREISSEDRAFLIDYQFEHGARGTTWESLPKIICDSLDSKALSNPYMPVGEKNIETYKKEYRLSIKLKRFMAYGVVVAPILLILTILTGNNDLLNTLWTLSACATILLYIFYRAKLLPKFEEFTSEDGKEVSFENSKLAKKLKEQNEKAEKYINSREIIETKLSNYDEEMKEYMNEFEKNNAVVAASLEELEKQKNNG